MPMSEPVDYLTEETYRPAWLKDGVTESTLEAVAAKKPELIELGKKIANAKSGDNFFCRTSAKIVKKYQKNWAKPWQQAC